MPIEDYKVVLLHSDEMVKKGVHISLNDISDDLGWEVHYGPEFKLKQADVNKTIMLNSEPSESFNLFIKHSYDLRFSHPKVVNYMWSDTIEAIPCDDVTRQLYAYSCATFPTIFNSKFNMDCMLAYSRNMVSMSKLVNRKWAYAPLGIRTDKIVSEGMKTDYLLASVWHSMRFKSKGIDRSIEVAEKHFASTGIKWKQYVLPNQVLTPSPAMEYLPQLGPEEKYQMFSKCRVFTSLSRDETYGLFHYELLQAGAVGIFWQEPHVSGLFAGYPFVYDNVDDVAAFAATLKDDGEFAEARKKVESWLTERKVEDRGTLKQRMLAIMSGWVK